MASRFRRRKRQTDEVSQELELMPMLNVFISIIPLLLLSAAFVEIAVIPASVTSDAVAAAAPAAGETPFDLAVVVESGRYVVQANGANVNEVARSGDLKASGAQLQAALARIAAEHPDHKEIRILAGGGTHYEDIISVMDAARGAGFPNASLDGDLKGID